jgi:hypothetical protein
MKSSFLILVALLFVIAFTLPVFAISENDKKDYKDLIDKSIKDYFGNNSISKGSMKVSGTEYSPNDAATLFLQLLDSQGFPIDNGLCWINIHSPVGNHSYTIQNAPMINIVGDDGLYYYDMTAPSDLGVYMVTARCSYEALTRWFYNPDNVNASARTVIIGSYTESPLRLLSLDSLYTKCVSQNTDYNVTNAPAGDTTIENITYNDVTDQFNLNVSDPTIKVLYTFDENTTNRYLSDLSNNGNNLWLGVSNKFKNNGVIGNTYNFNGGINNYGQSLWTSSVNFSQANQFTLSIWINSTAWTSATASAINQGNATHGWKLFHTGANAMNFSYVDNASSVKSASTGALVLGRWYNLIVVINSTNLSMYVNGTLAGSVILTKPFKTYKNDIWVGADAIIMTGVWNGTIDEVTIYNRSLNLSEISLLYKAQIDRFLPQGNQIYRDLTANSNQINLSFLPCNAYNDTSLAVKLGVFNGVDYDYNFTSNITNCFSSVNFTGNPTNISLKIMHTANNLYYAPVIYGNIQILNVQNVCYAIYEFNSTNLLNVTDMSLDYAGEANSTPRSKFYIFNWSSSDWLELPNSLTFHATAISAPTGVNEYVSNALPLLIMNNSIKIKHNTISFTTPFSLYDNLMNMRISTLFGTVQDIHGSSEMHITNLTASLINATIPFNATATALAVWNADTRTLTDYNMSQLYELALSTNATVSQLLLEAQNINVTVGNVFSLAQQINMTTLQNMAYLISINNTNQLILAIVTDSNTTIYYNKNILNQLETKIDYLNVTANDIKDDTANILVMLNNMTVGNLSVSANVNISAIVEAILGADVTETIVSSSGINYAESPSLLGGVAYAASMDTGINSVCIDNVTLVSSLARLRCVNSVCNTIDTNSTIVCQYGCNAKDVPNSCNSSPQQSNVFWFLVLAVIIFILIALILKFRH